MSKGNLFVGSGSGKVGNLVLANTKAGQVTRVYQPKVHNPKTYAQMYQRAKFADAVKFFKQATAGFFKFAFEDKAQNESDYNAFMRHNINNALPLSRDLYQNPVVPAMGHTFIMAAGRLTLPGAVSFDATNNQLGIALSGLTADATIGTVSNALVNAGFQDGDIVTFVRIASDVTLNMVQDSTSIPDTALAPRWTIAQFTIDTTSTQALSSVKCIGYGSSNGTITLTADSTNGVLAMPASSLASNWGAVVITRKVDTGLYASNSLLVADTTAASIEAYLRGDSVVQSAVYSWKANANVILKGSIAGLK